MILPFISICKPTFMRSCDSHVFIISTRTLLYYAALELIKVCIYPMSTVIRLLTSLKISVWRVLVHLKFFAIICTFSLTIAINFRLSQCWWIVRSRPQSTNYWFIIRPIRVSGNMVAHQPTASWTSAHSRHIERYRDTLNTRLNSASPPGVALLCNNPKCHDTAHCESLDCYTRAIITEVRHRERLDSLPKVRALSERISGWTEFIKLFKRKIPFFGATYNGWLRQTENRCGGGLNEAHTRC